jgi:hypothetical protein
VRSPDVTRAPWLVLVPYSELDPDPISTSFPIAGQSLMRPKVTRIGMATATSASPAMSPDAAGTEYC